MEQILSRKIDWRTIKIYDEDGSQIRNPRTLKAIAEAQEIAEEWKRSIKSNYEDSDD